MTDPGRMKFWMAKAESLEEELKNISEQCASAERALNEAWKECDAARAALEEIRPRCEQCGDPATRQFLTEGDGAYWLCDSTAPDHGAEFYCGDEVPTPKLDAFIKAFAAPVDASKK